jgi:hypothetical protein
MHGIPTGGEGRGSRHAIETALADWLATRILVAEDDADH